MDIRSDRQKGLSYTEIARKYNIDPRTAKKYSESETRPVYSLSATKPSKLDPYKEQITVWLEEAPYSAERILEKIQEAPTDSGAASAVSRSASAVAETAASGVLASVGDSERRDDVQDSGAQAGNAGKNAAALMAMQTVRRIKSLLFFLVSVDQKVN